jgi:hypothetical protein
MRKALLLAMVLVLATGAAAWAEPATGPRIFYSGMCAYDSNTGTVLVDTFICISNPNPGTLMGVGVAVYDQGGNKVWEGPPLVAVGIPSATIPKNGWRWITIGQALHQAGYIPPEGPSMTKYNFLVYWTKPVEIPHRFVMVEVKQIIYTQAVQPGDVWYAGTMGMIKSWSEAALGGKLVLGTYQQ